MKAKERDDLLRTLKARFEKNMHRHAGVAWAEVQTRIEATSESAGPALTWRPPAANPTSSARHSAGQLTFFDCSPESPSGRRSACYDAEALEARKENKPAAQCVEMAAAMGIELLTEEQYRVLQELGEFDVKTSNWIETPPEVRALGGRALLRQALWPGVRVSQRRAVVLRRAGLSGLAARLIDSLERLDHPLPLPGHDTHPLTAPTALVQLLDGPGGTRIGAHAGSESACQVLLAGQHAGTLNPRNSAQASIPVHCDEHIDGDGRSIGKRRPQNGSALRMNGPI